MSTNIATVNYLALNYKRVNARTALNHDNNS